MVSTWTPSIAAMCLASRTGGNDDQSPFHIPDDRDSFVAYRRINHGEACLNFNQQPFKECGFLLECHRRRLGRNRVYAKA